VNWRKLRTFLLTVLVLCIIPATRYYQIDVPLLRFLRSSSRIDPLSLHLAGEFVENNLGTEQEPDGSVTVRMIAEQYLFIPHCILVPVGVPVHLRITSADAVHSLTFDGTGYAVKVLPGTISEAQLQFSRVGEYKTACREFCGAGHYAMRSELKVVPREQFPALRPEERGNCAAASTLLLRPRDNPADGIPSYITWTPETIAAASRGDAFRGMLLARRCDHCHGAEGFSAEASTPNLASLDKLAIWKQLQDFRSHKRSSRAMEPIAESLSSRDVADVVAYYSKLPVFKDPQDNRSFPQSRPDPVRAAIASRLIAFGDGERGIPPCQACHGPVAFRPGVPSLANQNADYILNQLEAFANRTRANDINEPMRIISALLTEDERHALAAYYGSGLGLEPASTTVPR
jgi:cytochrome c553